MPNQVYSDFTKLRKETNDLIDQGRVRVLRHARDSHPELSDLDRIAVVRYGRKIQPDRSRNPSEGVYVCWAKHPTHGLCRGVFCIEDSGRGEVVLIITVFVE